MLPGGRCGQGMLVYMLPGGAHCIGLAGHEDIFVKWVLSMLESRFWCLSAGFWHGKLIGTIFRHLRLTQVAKMAIYGHSNDHKMAKFVTLVLSMLET